MSGCVYARLVALVVAPAAVADEVDDHVALEALPVLEARLAAWTTASGSSPFTWKTGAWTILATSVQYVDERASLGSVVKPIWLLMTTWMVPPVE